MITTERLEQMRAAELLIVQRPFQHPQVKANAEELAEALGELIEIRLAVTRRIECSPHQLTLSE